MEESQPELPAPHQRNQHAAHATPARQGQLPPRGTGIWDETTTSQAINPEQWAKAATGTPNIKGLIGYALDMKPDRSSLAIGGAVNHRDGTAHIELRRFEAPNPKAPNGRSTTSPTTGRAQQAWPSTRNHPP